MGSARWALALLATMASLFDAKSARASAWNEPQGHGLAIMDYTFSGGSRYFDGEGKLAPAAAYRKQEAFGYIEYGVTDWLMAVIKPDAVATSIAAPNGSGLPGTARYAGLGTSEAGAQLRLLAFGPAVLAVQGSFRLPGTTDQKNYALVGNTSRDADARLLFGTALPVGGWQPFLDAQLGFRMRSEGAPAEWHADFTLGARPISRLLLLVQSLTTIPEGSGTLWFPSSRYSKLGVAAVYDLNAAWSVEVGVFQTILGLEALRERGFQTGLWYRF